ncbi:MAG: hydroxymethylbilane synthase [Jatrophihabitans sp.]
MTTLQTVRIGTRASTLARAQTDWVAARLGGLAIEIVPVSTQGDRSAEPLAQLGGTGVFVSALRDALVQSRIDVAVHSFKDLPVGAVDEIALGAVPTREDARDALVARDGLTLGELPPGARVGTGSPRRAAQLRALGLGLEVVPIRGNIDTRLAMVADGRVDGVLLALAGLRRIGRAGEVTEIIDPLQMLPAPAQGALAVECRADDEAMVALLSALDDVDARATATAERAILAALQAGCSAPIGAMAEIAVADEGPELYLRGSVTALDGNDAVRCSTTGSTTQAEEVGRRLAADLLDSGATMMMESSNDTSA